MRLAQKWWNRNGGIEGRKPSAAPVIEKREQKQFSASQVGTKLQVLGLCGPAGLIQQDGGEGGGGGGRVAVISPRKSLGRPPSWAACR